MVEKSSVESTLHGSVRALYVTDLRWRGEGARWGGLGGAAEGKGGGVEREESSEDDATRDARGRGSSSPS